MSCDYQRYHIWNNFRHWYERNVPEGIREDFEDTIEDFVKNWIENELDEEGKRTIREYKTRIRSERKTKPKPKPVAHRKETGKKTNNIKETGPVPIERHIIANPADDPFEKVYRLTKDIVMPGHVQWKDDQREEMTEKMRRVMRWMRVKGNIPEADPIHGKKNLPRISSVAAYAVVHDWLEAQKVKMDSPFNEIYQTLWDDVTLDPEKVHELEHLLERLEIEMNKRKNASPEQEEELLMRINKISPELFQKITKKFTRLQTLTHA